MIEINLLPGRRSLDHDQRQTLKKWGIASVLMALGILFICQQLFSSRIKAVSAQVMGLENQLKKISHQPPLSQHEQNGVPVLGSPLDIHEWLKSLGVFYEQPVCFVHIEEREESIAFSGNARSVADLTDFLQHWQAVGLFHQIRLLTIQSDTAHSLVRFSFKAEVR